MVFFKVWKFAIVLYLFVIITCKWSLNPFTNPNPVYSDTYYVAISSDLKMRIWKYLIMYWLHVCYWTLRPLLLETIFIQLAGKSDCRMKTKCCCKWEWKAAEQNMELFLESGASRPSVPIRGRMRIRDNYGNAHVAAARAQELRQQKSLKPTQVV
jgi:hypothetical protein